MRLILVVAFVFVISLSSAFALLSPAAVYCSDLGYSYKIVKSGQGSAGVCILPNGDVDAWKFLKGEIGQQFSYCSKMGYELKIINNFNLCKYTGTSNCAACILPDGSEKEITRLMNLKLTKSYCGDGLCNMGEIIETYETCPQDCASGSLDGLCDQVRDGICDPDCLQQEDLDCSRKESCGDGVCSSGESSICPKDCAEEAEAAFCGNEQCEAGENFANCPEDCAASFKRERSSQARNMVILMVIFIVIGVAAFFLYRKIKSQPPSQPPFQYESPPAQPEQYQSYEGERYQ